MSRRNGRIIPRMPRFGGPDLRGRSVILIGPAATVTEELQDVELSDFDYVARMNNSIDTPITYRGAPYYYHNLYFRNQQRNSAESRAGHFDKSSAERCETQVVVFVLRRWRKVLRVMRNIVDVWRKGLDIEMCVLGPGFIRTAAARISPHTPTLGYITLCYLLDSAPKRLHIVGITFFTTKYINKYNDLVEKDADAMAWATRRGKHNPEAERIAFRRQFEEALLAGKPVTLGAGVHHALGTHPRQETDQVDTRD